MYTTARYFEVQENRLINKHQTTQIKICKYINYTNIHEIMNSIRKVKKVFYT